MDEFNNLIDKLSRNKSYEIEIEARIIKQLVNEESVQQLLSNNCFNWKKTTYTEQKTSVKSNRKCTYRRRFFNQDNRDEIICKSSLMKLDVNDMWCTIYISTETNAPSILSKLNNYEQVFVTRYRGQIGNYYIDVTTSDIYRVEVEAMDAETFVFDDMISVISMVCKILSNSPLFYGYYDWKIVHHVMKSHYGPFFIEEGKYQKPYTMVYKDIIEIKNNISKWKVTPKVDGIRCFIIIIGNRIFETNLSQNIKFIHDNYDILKNIKILHNNILQNIKILHDEYDVLQNTEYFYNICKEWNDFNRIAILDCEYLETNNMYYIFDIPVFNSKYYGNSLYRFDLLDYLSLPENFVIKPYISFGSFDDLSKLYNNWKESYILDGLIFVNITKPYINPVIKWKVYNTVDLEINNDNTLRTSDSHQINIKWEKSEYYNEYQQKRYTKIWEFRYETDKLIPTKPRPDKRLPNNYEIFNKTLKNAVSGSIFTGVGCYLMRKYHNIVKNKVIKDSNIDKRIILDIGTGQGGDVNKWFPANKIYCVEPNSLSTMELTKRLQNKENKSISEKIYIINKKIADVNNDELPEKIDIFTVFFCSNLFESNDWTRLQQIIKDKGSSKSRLLLIALTKFKESKNDVYDIVELRNNKYRITIHNTRIQDLTENIVNPVSLIKLMEECKLRLITSQPLDEDDFMTPKERTLSSMYTLFTFKKCK